MPKNGLGKKHRYKVSEYKTNWKIVSSLFRIYLPTFLSHDCSAEWVVMQKKEPSATRNPWDVRAFRWKSNYDCWETSGQDQSYNILNHVHLFTTLTGSWEVSSTQSVLQASEYFRQMQTAQGFSANSYVNSHLTDCTNQLRAVWTYFVPQICSWLEPRWSGVSEPESCSHILCVFVS